MDCRLPAFVDEVPDYQVRDGRMYISMGDLTLAMPIHVFEMGCARGKTAIAIWYSERGESSVVPLRDTAQH